MSFRECEGCRDLAPCTPWRVFGTLMSICASCRRRVREVDREPEVVVTRVEKLPESRYSVIDEDQVVLPVDSLMHRRGVK